LTEAKNLSTVETREGGLAGATADTKGKLVEYLFSLKKQGRSDHTIKAHRKVLTRLSNHGANIREPESVKAIIAKENVAANTKAHYVGIYTVFARWSNLQWNPPKYRVNRKLPFIPTENEIDQLIAGFKRKTATFLQILKETMARAGEVWKLEWGDLNKDIITVNEPEKGSYPRQFRLSENLTSMLKNLPKRDTRIFGPQSNLSNFRGNFIKRRKYLAKRLGNPRINRITFHTFRHWGATMLYHKTKDILYVQKKLGHRSIENTMIYTQLINFESDEWHVTHAGNLAEEDKAIQAGFEFVRFDERENVAIYRKRK
jgi:integrase